VIRKTPFDWLIVGLGNPGKDYARTRHNVGQEVVAELARRRGDTLRSGRDNALVAESRIGDERAVLAFPLTYMNDSGQAVRALVRRYGIEDMTRLVIVQDELDLAPTVVRVKAGGGLAGHNGLRSIAQHLGTQDFLRVRIGVGKPPGGKERGANHVLGRMPSKQREEYDVAVQEAADAVELIVTEGVDAAMRRYNVRDAGG
jgi:peptidyl-tRNA hydrolase, PTH1 family